MFIVLPNVGFRRYSGCLLDFFSNYSAKKSFERLILVFCVRPEGVVEHGLVVAAALSLNLCAEPIHKVTIQTDRDSDLPVRSWHDGTASGFAEIIIIRSHIVAPVSALPCVPR
jgi:hypothetical protein